MVLVGLML
jgi:hypothetical protein